MFFTDFPDQKYIGCTNNLSERLETNNSGGSIHTRSYQSWKLIMFLGLNIKKLLMNLKSILNLEQEEHSPRKDFGSKI
jgi:predicted GIY-YIG superfamily endonuclease